MKTKKILIAASVIFIAGSVIFSCQKERTQEPVKSGSIMTLKDVSADTYFTYSNNPVCLGDPVSITFDNGLDNNCGNIKIQKWNPETSIWELVAGPVTPVNGKASYIFTPDIGNYKFRGSWTRTGSPASCPGTNTDWQQVVSDLTVNELPTATLSGDANGVCVGTSTTLKVDLTGTPPWTITYEVNDWAQLPINIESTPYYFTVDPQVGTTIYTLTSVSDEHCDNTGSGSATVTAIFCCETIFSGEVAFCGATRQASYTFSYPGLTQNMIIQGSLIDFIGIPASVTLYLGGLTMPLVFDDTGNGMFVAIAVPYTITQWTPIGSSDREFSVVGPTSCTPLIIKVTWDSSSSDGPITGVWSVKDAGNITLVPDIPGLSCPLVE